ncbi:unnamed protein product [Rotaria socialis]|uniref:Uncharacterized protein n=1 Tax=Rotaria socialis TaxID=392032 RepID=A0A817SVX0_9BILA|nr:unnamed protein product [Rotaria socialis]
MDLTMDLSIRKPQQQQSPIAPSRPILNPAAPSSMLQGSVGRNSPLLLPPPAPAPTTASPSLSHTPVHQQQIKQQSQSYVPIPPAVQQQLNQVQQRVMQQTKYVQLLNVIEEMVKLRDNGWCKCAVHDAFTEAKLAIIDKVILF